MKPIHLVTALSLFASLAPVAAQAGPPKADGCAIFANLITEDFNEKIGIAKIKKPNDKIVAETTENHQNILNAFRISLSSKNRTQITDYLKWHALAIPRRYTNVAEKSTLKSHILRVALGQHAEPIKDRFALVLRNEPNRTPAEDKDLQGTRSTFKVSVEDGQAAAKVCSARHDKDWTYFQGCSTLRFTLKGDKLVANIESITSKFPPSIVIPGIGPIETNREEYVSAQMTGACKDSNAIADSAVASDRTRVEKAAPDSGTRSNPEEGKAPNAQ